MELKNKRKINDIFDFVDISNSLKSIKINENEDKKQKLILKEEIEEKNLQFCLDKIENLEKKIIKLENNLKILNDIFQNNKNELSYIS